MMGKYRRKNPQKEKMIMLASSVLVLSALTLTGVYVKERTRIQDENFAKLSQEETVQKEEDIAEPVIIDSARNPRSMEDALESEYGDPLVYEDETTELEAEVSAITPALTFSKEEGLQWPIVGKVLVNYSMDKTVYFETLDQYKYSPAVMIQANVGETITAAADGKVSSIYYDNQYGNCIAVELGDGYELTYGHLDDASVKEGDYIQCGDALGSVASPTKYFSKEGCNVYFKLTCDGVPCDPLNCMG